MANSIVQYILQMKDDASGALKKTGDQADQTSAKTKKTQERFNALGRSAVQLSKAMLAGGAAFIAFKQGVADSINALVDMETRTGISRDTLAGLQLAAEGSGLAFSSLERILVSFPVVISDVAQGTGKAVDAMDTLGIAVTDSEGVLKSADVVLGEVLTSLQAIEDPTQRAALATEVFGGQGSKLLQALGDSASLDHFVDRAREFGVDVGPMAAAAAGQWQRDMADLKMVLRGTFSELNNAVGDGGAVSDFAAGMVFLKELVFPILSLMIDQFAALGSAIFTTLHSGIAAGWKQLDQDMRPLVDRLQSMGNVVENATDKMQEFRRGAVNGASALGAMDNAASSLTDSTTAAAEAVHEIIFLTGEAKIAAMGMESLFENLPEAALSTVDPIADLRAELAELAEEIHGPVLSATDELMMLQINLDSAFKNGKIEASEYARAMENISRATEQATTSQGNLVAFLESGALTSATSALTGDIGGAISSAAMMMGPGGAAVGAGLDVFGALGATGPDGETGPEMIIQSIDDFKNQMVTGIEALPEFLPEFVEALMEAIPAIGEALAESLPALIEELIRALPKIGSFLFQELPLIMFRAIVQGIGGWWQSARPDWLDEPFKELPGAIWNALKMWWSNIWNNVMDFLRDLWPFGKDKDEDEESSSSSARSSGGSSASSARASQLRDLVVLGGRQPMGSRAQVALLHQGERMGQMGTGSGMAAGGGAPSVTINAAAVDRDAIPSLVRSIERAYGQFGRANSPLFGV